MSVEGIIPPPSAEEYWKEVARLRGVMISHLLAGQHYMFSVIAKELEKVESSEGRPVPSQVGQERRQALKDALATLKKAVDNILES